MEEKATWKQWQDPETKTKEKTKQNIVLSDGMGRGIKVGLNISPEVMIKEFMLKMGEMSDEVQTFIKEASNEYADMLGSMKEKSGSGVEKIPIKGGLISFILRSEGDATALPHKLNPLSGVRKVAMYW